MKESNSTAPAKFASHTLTVSDRKKLVMTGVSRMDGATDAQVMLTTSLGRLIVTGTELKIIKFDEQDGNLALSGYIDGIKYAAPKVSLLKRIFK